jgi:hypothetical protein
MNLINHPDLDAARDELNSYIEYLDKTADLLLDGDYVPPDPRGDLMQGMLKMKGRYFEAINNGAEEDRLEAIRTHLDQMAFLISKAQMPPPGAAPPGAPGMAPPGPPGAGAPPMAPPGQMAA